MTGLHHSVLREQVLHWLAPRSGGLYVDGTLGGGGHAEAILDASSPDGRVLGLDRDPAALRVAGERLGRFGDRVLLRHSKASSLRGVLEREGLGRPDGVLLDLGISSHQLEAADRGFSFQVEAPLDMRLDPSQPLTADEVVNQWPEADLAHALWTWGEEPASRRIARRIVEGRPIRDTLHLAHVVEQAVGGRRNRRIHPATQVFQALRIVVNGEIEEVEAAVGAAMDAVGPMGRVVAIAFHSLEDRAVKGAFSSACGKLTPRDPYGNPVVPPGFRLLTRGAVRGEDHDPHPRARSARLRAVERICSQQDTLPASQGEPASRPAATLGKSGRKSGF